MTMRRRRIIAAIGLLILLALAAGAWACRDSRPVSASPPPRRTPATPGSAVPRTVRVAAVQCHSRLGKVAANRELLTTLVGDAAAGGARIIVLPECAVPGYMDIPADRTWTSGTPADERELSVAAVAESVPGPSTRHFAALAEKLGVYLALPLIEGHDGRFYNALVLLDPHGAIAAHHRKHALWAPGDAAWATASDDPVAVADTPYGRLGLMICFDTHVLPPRLKKAGADIVLYAVGWYGPNTEGWFRETFPRRFVTPYGFAVVAANWSARSEGETWDGAGCSVVIDAQGTVLAMAKRAVGTEIVYAELPVAGRTGQ